MGGDRISTHLDTIPNTSHETSIERAPETAPDSERCPRDNGEGDMVNCAGSCVKYDEGSDATITKPHADPGLPPREAQSHH